MPPQLKQNLRRILSRFFDATSEFNNAFHVWQFRFFPLFKVKESRLPCFQSGKDGKCPHLICIRGWVSFLLREMPQASPHRGRIWAACECENIPLAKLKQLLSHSSCTMYVGHAPFLKTLPLYLLVAFKSFAERCIVHPKCVRDWRRREGDYINPLFSLLLPFPEVKWKS